MNSCIKFSLTKAAAALLGFAPAAAFASGYQLSPLESYLIQAFAQEQIEGFINTGTSSLFENPKVFYLRAKPFSKFAAADAKKASDRYVGKYGIINSNVFRVVGDREKIIYTVKNPSYTITLSTSVDSDKSLLKDVFPGRRHGFYCRIDEIGDKEASFGDCIPLGQFEASKAAQVENVIHRYLKGEKITDPNMPTYAMMAYMAIVSAKLLAEDSVCRTTVIEEVSYTPADRRLCTQEVSELWQNAALNPRFDETMDRVEDRLREDGVDVELIKQAASALD